MNMKDFSQDQQDTLLDLAILAMYADGHLAAVEDDRVQKLLSAMGYATEYDRNKHYDASVSRVSRHSLTAVSARDHAEALVKKFNTSEQRHQVLKTIDDLLVSDGRVASQENSYIELVRGAFSS
jgi:uncharacterized tellurite resistance protein B-like protein